MNTDKPDPGRDLDPRELASRLLSSHPTNKMGYGRSYYLDVSLQQILALLSPDIPDTCRELAERLRPDIDPDSAHNPLTIFYRHLLHLGDLDPRSV
jgi:hypothetical protein